MKQLAINKEYFEILEKYNATDWCYLIISHYNFYLIEFEAPKTQYEVFRWEKQKLIGIKNANTDNTIRKNLKVSKFLKNRGIPQDIIQKILTEIGRLSPLDITFKLEPMVDAYNNTEVQSCMQECGEYYESLQHCGQVLMGYDKQGNNIARAIIWSSNKIDGLPEGCAGFMDRIYPSDNHQIVNTYKEYAKAHNLLCKAEQSYSNIRDFIYQGEVIQPTLCLNTGGLWDTYTPYMDTFRYYDEGKCICSNSSKYNDYELTNIDGNALTQTSCCERCNERVDEDEIIWIEREEIYICQNCYDEYYFTCEDCGESHHNNDSYEVLGSQGHLILVCGDCLDSGNYFFSNYYDKWIDIDYAIVSNIDNDAYTIEDTLNYSDYDDDYSINIETVDVIQEGGSIMTCFIDTIDDYDIIEYQDKYYASQEVLDNILKDKENL